MKKVILSFIILHSFISFADEDDIQFNINILNAEDRENINLAVFSRDLYIVPGVYPLKIYINNTHLPEEKIHIVSLDGEKSEACLTPDIVEKFNLNKSALSSLEWQKVDELTCLSIASLSGMTANLSYQITH
nr:FimD/PapC N-terminal domain-containing protein [Providencia sp. M-27]